MNVYRIHPEASIAEGDRLLPDDVTAAASESPSLALTPALLVLLEQQFASVTATAQILARLLGQTD